MATDPATNPRLRSVLLVEDQEAIRGLLRLYLSGLPIVFHEASNGESAFDQAVRIRPDLIITDILMPEMDGIELIEILGLHPELRDIPVICCTAAEGPEQTRAIRAGAVLCLEKPIHRRSLLVPVCRILGLPEL